MDDTNSLIEQRKAKLAALRARGIDPFKNKFTPGETCQHAREYYAEGREVALAGRITAHRDMGKSMFMDLRDQSGRIQIYAQKNVLGDEQFAIFQHLDLADFIGVRGTMFTTKTNEISVKITGFVILAKALRPPPAKWHGLEDTEIRYRQRYLDLMANPEVKELFLMRSEIIREIRNFLHAREYVEVETPMMQAIPGGAAAQPFVTKHNALGCNFYLRIALELYLKRLLVGGVDKVFEIGRNFRNEGLSRKHNPEFTMLEAYEAYGDYESMMELVESMICHVAQKVLGTLKIPPSRTKELEIILGRFYETIISAQNNFIVAGATHEQAGMLLQKECENLGNIYMACSKNLQNESYWTVVARLLEAVDDAMSRFIKLKQLHENLFSDPNVAFREILTLRDNLRELSSPQFIDLTPPWRRVKYKDLIKEKINKDWFNLTLAGKLLYAEQVLEIEIAGHPLRKLTEAVKIISVQMKEAIAREDYAAFHRLTEEVVKRDDYFSKGVEDFEVTAAVFEKLIEPTLIQPTFVTHLPKELVPLAKLSPDDPTTVEVFECCINGQEIAPAYTEQNDPIAQRERLEHQAGGEQQKLDEDFLVALDHGMPPAGGMGLGIDRLCMMLLGQESIRDVILFPQLKPK